ncbi:MAG: Tex-like N-terminal domain-containing protein, partial [Candidatus Aminicenantes bacterium]
MVFEEVIAERLNLGRVQVRNTISLIEEGATVPFISRYRKELTGSLDELQVTGIRDAYQQLKEL